MEQRSFAITLDGTVSLERWSRVLSAWNASMKAIASEVGRKHVQSIRISGLSYGSAVTELEATFDLDTAADAFTERHDGFSRGLRAGNIVDFPTPLQKSGKRLLSAAKLDDAEEFILSSDTGDFVIGFEAEDKPELPAILTMPPQDQVLAYGGVIGVLQSLSSRGSLRAVVFDELNDKAVRCFITPDQHDKAGALWDQLVEVRGVVSRDPTTGRPLSVREVDSIEPIEQSQGELGESDWMKARGVLSDVHPELSSEELIRMVRDG